MWIGNRFALVIFSLNIQSQVLPEVGAGQEEIKRALTCFHTLEEVLQVVHKRHFHLFLDGAFVTEHRTAHGENRVRVSLVREKKRN